MKKLIISGLMVFAFSGNANACEFLFDLFKPINDLFQPIDSVEIPKVERWKPEVNYERKTEKKKIVEKESSWKAFKKNSVKDDEPTEEQPTKPKKPTTKPGFIKKWFEPNKRGSDGDDLSFITDERTTTEPINA